MVRSCDVKPAKTVCKFGADGVCKAGVGFSEAANLINVSCLKAK